MYRQATQRDKQQLHSFSGDHVQAWECGVCVRVCVCGGGGVDVVY